MARSPETYLNLVAVESEGVVGFVSAIFYRSFFHEGGTAMINELVVDEARRREGVGRTLVDAVIAEARSREMDEVEVSTAKENDRSLGGYFPTRPVPAFGRPRFPGCYMPA